MPTTATQRLNRKRPAILGRAHRLIVLDYGFTNYIRVIRARRAADDCGYRDAIARLARRARRWRRALNRIDGGQV